MGGAGEDRVDDDLFGGTFDGGDGNDRVTGMAGGTFYGRAGDDVVSDLSGGTFDGGDGYDKAITVTGGVCSTTVEVCVP